MGIQQLRVYALAENSLLIFNKKEFTARDPEDPGSLYPKPVTFSVGLNLTF